VLGIFRDPAPSLKSETVTGEFPRYLDSQKAPDRKILTGLVEMLSGATNVSV